MFENLKKKAHAAGQAVVEKTKEAAQATADLSKSMVAATTEGVTSSVDAQIERVLNLMERTAMRTAKRDTISSFQVTANLNFGLAEIGLTVEYDVEALRAKELSELEAAEAVIAQGAADEGEAAESSNNNIGE
jgi:hypothetical protein